MDERFDTIVDRYGTGSVKWDVEKNELPMWVADMDFHTAPCIRCAIEKRAAHGVFGYSIIPYEWAEAYRNWWGMHHGFLFNHEDILFVTGVIPAIASAIRQFTRPGEKILIQPPVYNHFFYSIINNGRRIIENRLEYQNHSYSMDFEDLEKKLSDPMTTMMILCNPHNPVGRIWTEEELARVGDLCEQYHVLVFSDEIHCDLTVPGKTYHPFASVSDACRKNSITAVAPTKTFNLAGIQSAAVIIPEEAIRQRMHRALSTDEVGEPNAFAMDATIAAFSEEGWEWLTALREYIQHNKKIAVEYIEENLPKVIAIQQEATYLMWLDVSAYTDDSDALQKMIRKNTGLFLNAGSIYGCNGNRFFRMNVACPETTLRDGLQRLKKALSVL